MKLLSVLLLAFATCIAATLVVHQSAWLITGRDRLYTIERRSPLNDVSGVMLNLRYLHEEGLRERKPPFWKGDWTHPWSTRAWVLEQVHLLELPDRGELLVIPRREDLRQGIGGMLLTSSGVKEHTPVEVEALLGQIATGRVEPAPATQPAP